MATHHLSRRISELMGRKRITKTGIYSVQSKTKVSSVLKETARVFKIKLLLISHTLKSREKMYLQKEAMMCHSQSP